jgi:copper chaperone CopZ
MTSATYAVTGLTCGHCVQSVISEVGALDGVSDVSVDLVVDGTSTVTVTSRDPLDESSLVAALDEAGSYELAL